MTITFAVIFTVLNTWALAIALYARYETRKAVAEARALQGGIERRLLLLARLKGVMPNTK